MGYRKEKREKMACPRSMTQKKIFGHRRSKKKNKYSHIAMSSCYPNKRERDS